MFSPAYFDVSCSSTDSSVKRNGQLVDDRLICDVGRILGAGANAYTVFPKRISQPRRKRPPAMPSFVKVSPRHAEENRAGQQSWLTTESLLEAVGFDAEFEKLISCEANPALNSRFSLPSANVATDSHLWRRQANQTSIAVLNEAWQNGEVGMSTKQLIGLESEVLSGECALQRSPEGALCRVVPIEVLRLHRRDESVLVCVGTWTQSKGLQPKCLLPAEKRGFNESPDKAIARLLTGELNSLWHFSCDLSFIDTTQEDVNKSSPSCGLQTQYMRTIHYARLSAEQTKEKKRKTRNRTGSTDMGRTATDDHSAGSTHAHSMLIGSPKRQSVQVTTLTTSDNELPTYPVDVILKMCKSGGSRYDLFSWLPYEEFQHFNSGDGKEVFEQWVGSFKAQLQAFIGADEAIQE